MFSYCWLRGWCRWQVDLTCLSLFGQNYQQVKCEWKANFAPHSFVWRKFLFCRMFKAPILLPHLTFCVYIFKKFSKEIFISNALNRFPNSFKQKCSEMFSKISSKERYIIKKPSLYSMYNYVQTKFYSTLHLVAKYSSSCV